VLHQLVLLVHLIPSLDSEPL